MIPRTLFNSDHEALRDTVRRFLENEAVPHHEEWEQSGQVPKELWRKAGEQGFLCPMVSEEYGGLGADFLYSVVVSEEISRAGLTGIGWGLHTEIVAPYIEHYGSEALKHKYLPKMVTGEMIGAIAMSEPGAGSDLQGMKTRAEKDGDGYVISGQKTFITNGQHCDVIVLATKTDPNAGSKGMTLFTVDTSLPGFARGRNLEKMGHHAADTSELFFENVKVGADQILGGEGRGFANLMNELPRERLILALGAVAACEGMIERTIAYTQERQAFGQSISKFQNTRFVLADLHAQVQVNKAFCEQSIEQYDRGELSTTNASIAKLTTTELQGKVADQCLQLFGGYGYMQEYPISRDFVDARIQRIYGGTSEIMKEIIARDILGR